MFSEELKKIFGNRVKEIRETLGFSRIELAKEAKITLNTLRRIENGLAEPRASTVTRIQNVLGIEYGDFFEFENNYSDKIYKSYICNSVINLSSNSLKKYFTTLKLLIKYAKEYEQNENNFNSDI